MTTTRTFVFHRFTHIIADNLTREEADMLREQAKTTQFGELCVEYDLRRDCYRVGQLFIKIVEE